VHHSHHNELLKPPDFVRLNILDGPNEVISSIFVIKLRYQKAQHDSFVPPTSPFSNHGRSPYSRERTYDEASPHPRPVRGRPKLSSIKTQYGNSLRLAFIYIHILIHHFLYFAPLSSSSDFAKSDYNGSKTPHTHRGSRLWNFESGYFYISAWIWR
jgi:hypothetical protein